MQSFKGKLILLFIPIFLLFGGALSALSIVHHYTLIKSKIIDKGVAVVETLSHACEFGAVTYDSVLLDWATKEIRNDPKVLFLVVYDPNGHILFSHNEHGLSIDFPSESIAAASVVYREAETRDNVHTIDFTAPINRLITHKPGEVSEEQPPEIVGYIRLLVSAEELGVELRATLLSGAGLTLIFLVLGMMAIIFISRQVTRPIEQLSLSVRRFGEGNFEEHVSINTKDEIGQLASNFNQMADSLREARGKLERSKDELEITVAMRTAQLKKSEERYRTLLDSSPDPIVVNDINGDVTYVNSAFTSIFGWTGEEMLSRQLDIMPADTQKNLGIMLQKIIAGINISGLETGLMTKKGEQLAVGINGAALYDKDGGVMGSILVMRDVTVENRLKEQLSHAKKMEALGTLAGGVAHDLNNILSGVVTYPEVVLMSLPKDNPVRATLESIKSSGEKAAAVVQDLLTLARRGTAIAEPINLNEVTKEFTVSPEFIKIRNTHPLVDFQIKLEPGLFNILGSPVHIGKTIMNLIMNGAEAIEGTGVINVSSFNRYIEYGEETVAGMEEGDYACLQVRDTGIGISKEDCLRIYEPFFTKKVMGRSGTGLGMAVVWGTVQDHNGFIELQSEQGKGTTFTLYFPATRESLKKQQFAELISSCKGDGETILVVDDVKEQREIASTILVALEYEPIAVESGEKAVAYLQDHKVDLVIIDMIMDPGMDGLETYQEILKIDKTQKVIIASGFSETARVKKARKLGVNHYVSKPYLVETIALAIKESLEEDIPAP